MVIWLLGISGSGKSTLGKGLKKCFDKLNKHCYLIDGDDIRGFYDNDLGYSRKDRTENIKRIILAAYVLDQNGIIAIVCNISPFEKLRNFARKKIKGYIQVYLKKDISISQKHDVKKIYKRHKGKTPLVGIDLKFDKPRNNDLVIDIDNESERQSLQKIIDFLRHKSPKTFS
ncbi:MAG: hypothetical protein A2173_03640 [Planctomycetes bacterium RBG_13_44_8b]|nr:MAG: hypothetical protein A2173_03640 [Planctomycetes bacterium RBG_13_44_8b]